MEFGVLGDQIQVSGLSRQAPLTYWTMSLILHIAFLKLFFENMNKIWS